MKAVLQRVSRARVTVAGEEVGRVDEGLCVLLGVLRGDGPDEARRLAERVARFRVFGDERGRMNRSLLEVGAGALVVSQFTLAHEDGRAKGRRPSFDLAADPELAEPLVEVFVESLRALGVATATGRFGASMSLELVNEGPVTFLLEERAPPAAGTGVPGQRS